MAPERVRRRQGLRIHFTCTRCVEYQDLTRGPRVLYSFTNILVLGDDQYGYESAAERWLPIHTVETIVLSVISMLSAPNDESAANLEAAVSTLDVSYALIHY